MKLYPATLWGEVTPPVSKSILHRELICQAMCGEYPQIPAVPKDVQMTQRALIALRDGEKIVDCGESGTTLRFLLPLAAAMGKRGVTFTGSPRLLERPVPAGLPIERTQKGWCIREALRSGAYLIDASRTSQVTSGLLMALPLLEGDSVVRTENAVSSGYVDMTVSALHRYGIGIEKTPDGFAVPGGQKYQIAPIKAETDWSAAAWYAMANRLSNEVNITTICNESKQPDKAILDYLDHLPDTVDISVAPDIFPVLALYAALCPGKVTKMIHCAFLRDKESDRLRNVQKILTALGVRVEVSEDTITIFGRDRLHGGVVIDPDRDHRMVFLAAFAALFCDEPIELLDSGCVSKSYPQFWKDYVALGGQIEE